MADLQHKEKIVSGDKITVVVGANKYNLKKIVRLHLNRPKKRDATSDGPIKSYGVGDHDAELILTGTEDIISTLIALNKRSATGKLVVSEWKIVIPAQDLGTSTTITLKATLPEIFFEHGEDENLEIRCILDITDDIVTTS